MISRLIAGLFALALVVAPLTARPDSHEAGEADKAETPAVEAGDMQGDKAEGEAAGEPAEGSEKTDTDEAAPE